MKTNFIFRSLLENEREQAVHFIEYREIECTALMEKLLSGAEDIFVLENIQNGKFCALFYLRNNSTIFHFIPFLSENENPLYNYSEEQKQEIRELIFNFMKTHKIFCVYGESKGTEYIKSLLLENNKKIIASIDYILMKNDFTDDLYSSEIKVRDNWKNLNVRKCSMEDRDLLIDLERGYRVEEVQISEREETDQVIRYVLEKSLSSQTVFAAWKYDGKKEIPVAKAATNARGKNYFQIGGVYCSKEFRNQGFMNYVMQNLLRYIRAEGKTANLFVKTKNEPAKKLYENLGFVPVNEYQISYFEK